MKTFLKKLWDVADDVLAYILTVVGILAANYIPMLESGQTITIDVGIGRVVVAGLVALLVVGYSETKGDNRDGKKSNWKLRYMNAIMHGLGWQVTFKLIAGAA